MKDKLKSIIVGAGRIASGFDNLESEGVLTHAHAYKNNDSIELCGFFDIDQEKSKKAAEKWSCKSYDNFDEMFEEVKPDIVSICTPDETHSDIIEKVLSKNSKLIICEKPVTSSSKDTERIIKISEEKSVPVLVNFSRRFDTKVRKIKENFDSGKYGSVICASGIYSKGIKHNGSHMIDLVRYFFGEVIDKKPFYCVNDYKDEDKTVSGFMIFEKCPQFHLLAGDETKYSVFELDIFFEKARIRFINSGFVISEQLVEKDRFYPDFVSLSKPTIEHTELQNAMSKMVENAVDNIENGTELICDISDALKTQKICEELLLDL